MTGGLKLTLEAANSRDRRVRFAEVWIRRTTDGEPMTLVTDAEGRMRYRLSEGDYRLSMSGGPTADFSVIGNRWTSVRVRMV